jgi:hypothetical protein
MDRGLETLAHRVKFGILSKESGWLHLDSDGFISFKYRGDLVFRAPLQEVRASFPKVTFLWGAFFRGAGIELVVDGETYRLLFVPLESSGTGEVSRTWGGGTWGSWSWSSKDLKQGKATAQQWRAALGQPVNSGH